MERMYRDADEHYAPSLQVGLSNLHAAMVAISDAASEIAEFDEEAAQKLDDMYDAMTEISYKLNLGALMSRMA